MFQKILTAIVASMICTSMAFAYAPTAKRATTIDGYSKELRSEHPEKSDEEIKKDMVEALRKEGKFSEEDLERINRDKVDFDPAKQKEMVSLLRKSSEFKARVGVAAMKSDAVSKSAGEAFEKMKEPKAENKAPESTESKKNEPTAVKKEELALANITANLGAKAFEAVVRAEPQHYQTIKKVALILAKRVKNGQIKREAAEQLLIDTANSPKVLNGDLVLGEGSTEACMGMAGEAIENLAKFVRGGAEVGKDPISYTKGMGDEAAKLFKQELEEGLARVCALATSGCKLLSETIASACKSINGAKP